ncbi:MAG TPA: transglutaminase domain-containing protein, partial [Opitutaceae bacterium]|nr:transglutaminase domain-containing protein [Opitutaceae bacterium]
MQLGGTVDAENTRDPIVYSAWQQGFQPMRSVRIENVGDIDVVNPWVLVNGKRDWRSTDSIVAEALRTRGNPAAMSDAEKARALWQFVCRHRFHATTGDLEVRDPVKLFNVYGYALCGDAASVLMDLWRAAGLKARRGFPMGHCVAEVWYDGAWHLFDADLSVIYLDRDNESVLGEKSVAHDHDLIKRAHADEYMPALYGYNGTHAGDYASHPATRMNLTLRPGEALEWRWANAGKHHYAREPIVYAMKGPQPLSNWGATAAASPANGKWIYTPRLPAEKTPLSWKIETPYVIVGGHVAANVRGACNWSISLDGLKWQSLGNGTRGAEGNVRVDLDPFFAESGKAAYRYHLRAEPTHGDAGLERITIENDLQMASLSLPALELGENVVRYTDETTAPHSVRIDFDFVERSSVAPPAAPAKPRHPLDGTDVEGTSLTFRWEPVEAAAGERIVDYQFQLGGEASLREALAPSFEGQTKGATEFILSRPGRLTAGKRYFWHVRAKSDRGVWGAWSPTWNFVPQGPALPINVRFGTNDPDKLTLAWDVARDGRKPAAFRIYASDEKGFSVSDSAYEVAVGNQRERGLFPGRKTATFPANFLAAVSESTLSLRPRHAFYRVVAVDENGTRSGSSEYVVAPRPFIHSDPPRVTKVGAPVDYTPKTIASIGDLTYRDFGIGGPYQGAFWDAERPAYSF